MMATFLKPKFGPDIGDRNIGDIWVGSFFGIWACVSQNKTKELTRAWGGEEIKGRMMA